MQTRKKALLSLALFLVTPSFGSCYNPAENPMLPYGGLRARSTLTAISAASAAYKLFLGSATSQIHSAFQALAYSSGNPTEPMVLRQEGPMCCDQGEIHRLLQEGNGIAQRSGDSLEAISLSLSYISSLATLTSIGIGSIALMQLYPPAKDLAKIGYSVASAGAKAGAGALKSAYQTTKKMVRGMWQMTPTLSWAPEEESGILIDPHRIEQHGFISSIS